MDLAVLTATLVSDGGRTRQTVSLDLVEGELDLMSVIEIKGMLIQKISPVVTPGQISISIGGAELFDDWIGEDFGLQVIFPAARRSLPFPASIIGSF